MRILTCLLVVGLMIGINNVYSQSERFIEVVAVDTVVLKSTSFHYEITTNKLSDEINPYGDLMDSQDPEEYKVGRSLFEIAEMLKKEKFDFTIGEPTKSPLTYLKSDSSIIVVLNNDAELERLKKIISEESDISGSMKEVFYESASNYHEKTYSTLYSRALEQASLMAKITKNEIGKVISVSENNPTGSGWGDLYEEIMKKAAFGLYGENEALEKEEIVKMIFRFELK